ncbi:MAG TPA: hypothetical protein VN843_33255 [Anaerolineales bacterium]|nr:hypothetical protein [Anaerolineales bacterium]
MSNFRNGSQHEVFKRSSSPSLPLLNSGAERADVRAGAATVLQELHH